jgi:SAM-dependent methyltransferase
MMATSFCCPKCKGSVLIQLSSGYQCKNCGNHYFLQDGYVDFLGDIDFYAGEITQQEMHTLLADIDSSGYDHAMIEFFRRHPALQDYVIGTKRADWLCHCIGKNRLRCLDIGSGLGNISELLSYTYQQVYSLEAVKERIDFQKRRYKNSARTNITIARGNAFELPFPDNYFDLLVCNGVMEWIGMMNSSLPPRQAQLSFLHELRRVLSDEGCLYIGIENRFGLHFLLGAEDHSGLHYTSILPRRIANFIVRNFGYSGGIYGDRSKKEKEKRGYYTYTYSIFGYYSLIRQAGFKFKSYWVFPSYNEPYNSGRLDDKIGLKGHIHYFKNSTPRFKLVLSLSALEKLDKSVIAMFASLFSPSFLFYCYKNEIKESLDDLIVTNAKLKNYTTISHGTAIKYILYDKKGEPLKVVHLKRGEYRIPKSIPFHDKTQPQISRDPSELTWIENWIPAKTINPLKLDEAEMAIQWLINFQNENHTTSLTENDISTETNALKQDLSRVPQLEAVKYVQWIDNYESYIRSLNVRKTAEHGDFFYNNILLDSTTRKIVVIDWENFRESGDPFYDFVFFIINAMVFRDDKSDVEFRSNLEGAGKFSSIMRALQIRINAHFGFELNFDILIRYVILRFTIRKFLEAGIYDGTFIQFNKMLGTLESFQK